MRARLGVILAIAASAAFCLMWALIPLSRHVAAAPQATFGELLPQIAPAILPRLAIGAGLIFLVMRAFAGNRMRGYVFALAAMPVMLAADMALEAVGLT